MDEPKAPLRKGVAYHGNRMLSHIREDMLDIVEHGFDTVVHMFTHNDWERHKDTMRQTVEISKSLGLEVWIDNWGLGGPPGELSHFMGSMPDSQQVFNDGTLNPIQACYNDPRFVQFTKDWIDAVGELGTDHVFWDEPNLHASEEKEGIPQKWSCRCPRCRALFEEQYGSPMPAEYSPEVAAFRTGSIVGYFEKICRYAKEKGLHNHLCVMLTESAGIGLKQLDQLCTLPTLDGIGSDPYWIGFCSGYEEIYPWVYQRARKNLELCERYGKEHNLWIQGYLNQAGSEEEIIAAADALYDAGARNIFVWGYRGSEANDYRSRNPDKVWKTVGDAMQRITERDREIRRIRAREEMQR